MSKLEARSLSMPLSLDMMEKRAMSADIMPQADSSTSKSSWSWLRQEKLSDMELDRNHLKSSRPVFKIKKAPR